MHDPMAALPSDPRPNPTPWESLAQQARRLAELADRCAAMPPADLAPVHDVDGTADLLADLDSRALAIRSVVAACRRATWQELADQGHTAADIARMWGVTRQAVSQTLVRPNRPR